jgi:hypothetical protein
MKEYFLLQYKMTNRKLSDWGINPFGNKIEKLELK